MADNPFEAAGFTPVGGGTSTATSLGRPVIREGPKPANPPTIKLPEGWQTGPTGRAERIPGVPSYITDPPNASLTEGQKALDQQFGKDYADWKANGGFSGIQTQLKQLRDAHARLGSGKNLTGPVLGRMPDFVTSFTNPDAVDVRQETHGAIQASLRQILGAQFTEEEGKRIMNITYDPSLPEHTNRLRVTRLYNQIATAAKAKESAARYFEQNGTLRGWKGSLWGISDFDPDKATAPVGAKPQASGGPVSIKDDAGYDRLPSGSLFIGPDGQTRRKP